MSWSLWYLLVSILIGSWTQKPLSEWDLISGLLACSLSWLGWCCEASSEVSSCSYIFLVNLAKLYSNKSFRCYSVAMVINFRLKISMRFVCISLLLSVYVLNGVWASGFHTCDADSLSFAYCVSCSPQFFMSMSYFLNHVYVSMLEYISNPQRLSLI